jgi:hypothetical protein
MRPPAARLAVAQALALAWVAGLLTAAAVPDDDGCTPRQVCGKEREEGY